MSDKIWEKSLRLDNILLFKNFWLHHNKKKSQDLLYLKTRWETNQQKQKTENSKQKLRKK